MRHKIFSGKPLTNTDVLCVEYDIICAMSLIGWTVINGTMKLLALALSVALLFAAGESATDPPLNKHHVYCCAMGTSAINCSLYCTGTDKPFRHSETFYFLLASYVASCTHTFSNNLLKNNRYMQFTSNLVRYTRGWKQKFLLWCFFLPLL